MAYIESAAREDRFIFLNNEEQYRSILNRKKIRALRQYATLPIKELVANTENQIQVISHIWTTGDKYYKLANQFYGRPGLWWIIALYNKKPTEGHLRRGDIVEIPTPIELVLYYI